MCFLDCHVDVDNVQRRDELVKFYGVQRYMRVMVIMMMMMMMMIVVVVVVVVVSVVKYPLAARNHGLQ